MPFKLFIILYYNIMNTNNSIQRQQESEQPTLTRQFRVNNLENQPTAVQLPETYTYGRAVGDEDISASAVPTVATRLPPIARIHREEPEAEIPIAQAIRIPKRAQTAYQYMIENNIDNISGTWGHSAPAQYYLLPGGRVKVVTQVGYADTARGIRESRNQSNIYVIDQNAYNQWRIRPRTPEQPPSLLQKISRIIHRR
jgi:hypothetical protein